MSRDLFRRVRSDSAQGLEKFLGELEMAVMEIVWAQGEVTVRDVRNALEEQGRTLAYTTVMTVMSRLAEKGWLTADREGRAYLYRATHSREEARAERIGDIIRALLDEFGEVAVTRFVKEVDETDKASLEQLARLAQQGESHGAGEAKGGGRRQNNEPSPVEEAVDVNEAGEHHPAIPSPPHPSADIHPESDSVAADTAGQEGHDSARRVAPETLGSVPEHHPSPPPAASDDYGGPPREPHPAEHAPEPSHHEHEGHDAPPDDAHAGHEGHATPSHEGHERHGAHMEHAGHAMSHEGHGGHGAHADHTGHEEMFRQRFWVSLLLSIPVLLYSPMVQEWLRFTMPSFPGSDWIAPLFSVVIFYYGGLPFLRMALPELRERQPGMMTLISLAISVAFIYSVVALFLPDAEGFFWELVTLIDIMLLGHWLEMSSVRQASGSLDELARLLPDEAERIRDDGGTETIPVGELRPGDRVLVRPGTNIPADGVILDGASSVNESMITGESRPVSKKQSDTVIAGTINGDGSLRVEITATGDSTALAGIMRLVEEAQHSRSRTQLLADRAAAWLFYIALGAAALTAVGWALAVGWNVDVLQRVVTVLVIACPHALGLAVPLVVAITTSLGAQNGLLIRDRLALERAREADIVLFDKTGTLTLGEHGIVDMAVVEGVDEGLALALAAAVEGDSEHHIARAFRRAAAEIGASLPEVSDFRAHKGRGVQARVEGHDIFVGGPALLEMLDVRTPESLESFVQRASEYGQGVIHLIVDRRVMAVFALADQLRPESREAVRRLHELGIEVAMITGDDESVAHSVAGQLRIDHVFANVLPENKDQKVIELQRQGRTVVMVGDGVNDAPALTRADVGIAIGSGTDVAVESAGIILVQSNPLDVVRVIKLSRATYGKMVQNLWWAAGYNIVALPLAAGILVPVGIPAVSPAVGALLMSLSTIIVAINAQLLRRVDLVRG